MASHCSSAEAPQRGRRRLRQEWEGARGMMGRGKDQNFSLRRSIAPSLQPPNFNTAKAAGS